MDIKQMALNVKETLKEHSPQILIGLGIAGSIGSTVLACKATLKLPDIMENHKSKMDFLEDSRKRNKPSVYSLKDFNRDKMIATATTAKDIVIDYAPALTLGALSIASILYGYKIISGRYVATVAAYGALEKTFTSYRNRVIDEYGAKKDEEIMSGLKAVQIEKKEKNKNGKTVTKKVEEKVICGKPLGPYARFFCPPMTKEEFVEDILNNKGKRIPKEIRDEITSDDYKLFEGSDEWRDNKEYARFWLTCLEKNLNRVFNSRKDGKVFANEYLDQAGFSKTDAGQVEGWSKDRGDTYISLGIVDYPTSINYVNGCYLINPNIKPGPIIGRQKQ